MALQKIGVQVSPGFDRFLRMQIGSKNRKGNSVYDFSSPIMGHRQRFRMSSAPASHLVRPFVGKIKMAKRAWIYVRALSGYHDSPDTTRRRVLRLRVVT